MADNISTIILFAFIATLPARMPALPAVFYRPVVRAALVPHPPLWFIAPDPVYLVDARTGLEELNSRDQSSADQHHPIRPAWECLLFVCLACLHAELNRAVIASYVWCEFIRQTSVVFVSVLCLVALRPQGSFRKRKPLAKLLIALLVSAVVLMSIGAL